MPLPTPKVLRLLKCDISLGSFFLAGLGSGRRLKLYSGLGASIDFRSNNHAFSASASVSPKYFATLYSDDFGERNGGLAAALAYAADLSPDNWIRYAKGEDIDEVLLEMLARGPTATTDTSVRKSTHLPEQQLCDSMVVRQMEEV